MPQIILVRLVPSRPVPVSSDVASPALFPFLFPIRRGPPRAKLCDGSDALDRFVLALVDLERVMKRSVVMPTDSRSLQRLRALFGALVAGGADVRYRLTASY